MKRGVYLAVMGVALVGGLTVTTGGAQVYPVRWHEPDPVSAVLPLVVLADGHLQFPDGTVQKTAPGSGESLGAPPSPTFVLADGGIEFPDGTVQTTAAGALVPRSGQTLCYALNGTTIDCMTDVGPGQDGDLQMGAPWPNPRFTDHGDGTVTDNLTGLVWLEDAGCLGSVAWAEALDKANSLFDGCTDCGGTSNDCGLADGSSQGDWHLANLRELQSLFHYGVFNPAIPNTAGTGKWTPDDPFKNVSGVFWTSTSSSWNTTGAFAMGSYSGEALIDGNKLSTYGAWPVRAP